MTTEMFLGMPACNPEFDKEKCTGCGLCQNICLCEVIEIKDKKSRYRFHFFFGLYWLRALYGGLPSGMYHREWSSDFKR